CIVKFVGIFVVALIGLYTLKDLWDILENLNIPMWTWRWIFQLCISVSVERKFLHQAKVPRDVAYGAVVTIKSHKTGGGYLHSHWHLYPKNVGVQQQQVTIYSHKDETTNGLLRNLIPILVHRQVILLNLFSMGI
ncbi:protein O-mannosyl-transferase 2, partial [Trichonephila clavipes]